MFGPVYIMFGPVYGRLLVVALVVLLSASGCWLLVRHAEEKGRIPVARIVNDTMETQHVTGFLGSPTCAPFDETIFPKGEFYPKAPYHRLPNNIYIEVAPANGGIVRSAVFKGLIIPGIVRLSDLTLAPYE